MYVNIGQASLHDNKKLWELFTFLPPSISVPGEYNKFRNFIPTVLERISPDLCNISNLVKIYTQVGIYNVYFFT